MNFNELQTSITNTARQKFLDLQKKIIVSNISGYALYSDADAMSISLAINTKTHLEQYQESDDPIYYKWSPEEWEFSSEGEDVFRTISQELTRESLSEQSDKEHSAFVESVFKCCVESLKELKKEGLFNDSPDAVIMFSVFDYDEDTECEWIEQLNTIELSDEFRNWI